MRTRNRRWTPSSRKSLLRQAARAEKFTDPVTGKVRAPRDSLEVLRLIRHHPRLMPGPEPTESQRQREADLERLDRELKQLPAQMVTDLYKAQGETMPRPVTLPGQSRKRRSESATPSTPTNGTSET